MKRLLTVVSLTAAFGCGSAGVQSAPIDPSQVKAAEAQIDAETAALRAQAEQQAEEIRMLRGQLAFARAGSQRPARCAPPSGAARSKPTASNGASDSESDPRPEPSASNQAPSRTGERSDEPRVLLRIYGDAAGEKLTVTDGVADLPSFDEPVVSESDERVQSYRRGLSLVRGQQFDEALLVFTDFLKLNPDHPYADNALFWCGEIRFLQGRHRAALQDFERMQKQYPRGNKLPDALYRMGLIHLERGDSARARGYFKQVREQFPDTAAARLAAREDAS